MHQQFTMDGLEPGSLEGSTALLKVALRAAQAGSWAWDLVTREIFWSDEYHHLIGTDPATVQPSYEAWLEKVHPDDVEPAAAQMRMAIDTQREINIEFRIIRPDGLRWMRSQGQILYGAQGEPLKMVGVTFDVTDRRLAEEALRRREEELRIITNGVPALISYIDAGQHYRFNNRSYEDWFGCTAQDLKGKHVREVLGEAAYEDLRPYMESALAGREVRFETWIEYRGAGSRCVDVHYVPDFAPSGKVRGFFALINDFTEHKQTEAALKETDRRKDEFLAMLAHELRNPLAPIRNAVEVIRHLGLSDPQLDRMSDVIERQTRQLTRMVDDLLDVARISQGKIALRKEKIDLLTIVGRAVETSRPLIDAGGHRLSVALPADSPRLEGDVSRLAQVLSNLLNNAAKYTEPGGNIWLTAEWQDGDILLRVKDDGIGIPTEVLPRVFELFAQADRGLDRAQGGLGIGLTLVKSIVEMHGGTVSAFSQGPGQGSEFSVRLPVLDESLHPVKEDSQVASA
ncbi:MAG TPA: ATP-binding protein [Thermoanaerobaculia bacterium]|nr:ATP-binding protein [Thermoanaerobaculia bacterium]